MATSLAKLAKRLGYEFADEALLARAVTHRSHGKTNNERLEFLGDSILNFIIAEFLFTEFPDAREGQLSRLRASLVRRETLAEVARELDLGDALIMGSGELKSGGFDRDSILSDALEAIIGAVYLEAGIARVTSLLEGWFRPRIDRLSVERSGKDPKTRLQEYLQARSLPLPEYEVVSVEGMSHDQVFRVVCHADLLAAPTEGEGTSRRFAEQAAAAAALAALEQS